MEYGLALENWQKQAGHLDWSLCMQTLRLMSVTVCIWFLWQHMAVLWKYWLNWLVGWSISLKVW